jgi:prepilin-type N-terminal cleavage/methylation domain-containing protein
MRLTPVRNRRAAFTLTELLIVMGIIAVLASISIGAVFTLRESQIKNASETTVQKLASALDQQMKTVMDQVFEETPAPSAMALSAGATGQPDLRRARVIYTKLRLAQEFPQTFAQVRLFNAGGSPLPAKPAILQSIPTASAPQDWESSALLYLALKQGRRGQAAFDAATVVEPAAIQTRSVSDASGNRFDFQIFVDAWGNPLRFYLFPFDNDELNAAPYATTTTTAASADTVDPEGTLMTPSWRLNGSGSALSPKAQAFATYCHRLPSKSDPNPSVAAKPDVARVLVPVVASTGKDGAWGLDNTPLTSPFMRITNYDQQTDNIYSYRLRRFGNRGD